MCYNCIKVKIQFQKIINEVLILDNNISSFLLWGEWTITEQISKTQLSSVYKAQKQKNDKKINSNVKYISVPPEKNNAASENGAFTADLSDKLRDNVLGEIITCYALRGHPNIVSYEDHCCLPKKDGSGYDIFIRTENLYPLSSYMNKQNMTEKEIIQLGIDICSALEALEERKSTGSGIRLTDIYINSSGVYQLDIFNEKRAFSDISANSGSSYQYMSPEMLRNEKTDITADIYSLGLILYRLVNNKLPPFASADNINDDAAIPQAYDIRRLGGEKIPLPSNCHDHRLSEIIMKACESDKHSRYKSPKSMKEAFKALQNGTAATYSAPHKTEPPMQQPTQVIPAYSPASSSAQNNRQQTPNYSRHDSRPNNQPMYAQYMNQPKQQTYAEKNAQIKQAESNKKLRIILIASTAAILILILIIIILATSKQPPKPDEKQTSSTSAYESSDDDLSYIKKSTIDQIRNSVDKNNYHSEQYEEIITILNDYERKIQYAKSESEIYELYSQAIDDISKIKTSTEADAEESERRESEREAEESSRAEESRKAAEESSRAEASRLAEEEESKRAEESRKAAEESSKAEESRKAAEESSKAEASRRAAEESSRAEASRRAAEESARAEESRRAAEESRTIHVDTDYFSLDLPAVSETGFYYEYDSNSISFYDQYNYDLAKTSSSGNGWIYTVKCYNQADSSWKNLPRYDVLYETAKYIIIVIYPTDVRYAFTDTAQAKYNTTKSTCKNALSTLRTKF